jgi:hypothetical protein
VRLVDPPFGLEEIMRAQRIVLTLVTLVVALAFAHVGQAQTGNAAANISSVVRGGVVVVSYDLPSADAAATFKVELEVSGDGGQTYAVRPRTVTGDLGPSVRAGTGKQITWEAARDVETLEFDRYRYRVRAEPVRAAAAPGSGLAPQSRPAASAPGTQSTTPPPATPSVAAATRSKGPMWGGIALMGFGGTMMALAFKQHSHDGFWDSGPKAQLWIGVGALGGGVTLLALSSRTRVVANTTGLMLRHDLTF